MAVSRSQTVSQLRAPRMIAAFLACFGAATCTDSPAAADGRKAHGRAHITFAPTFSAAASNVLSQRGVFPGVTFDHVRVVLARSSGDVVADTSLAFTPETPAITLDLTVQVTADGETFDATIDYTNSGVA